MNQERARDFFSAYYEGNLDAGLRQSFELNLRSDAILQSDYAAFVETVHELEALKHEQIEIPIFLSDRIATRLELAQGKPKSGFPGWTGWLRGLAFTGLAAAAIIFAFPFFHGGSDLKTAGPNLASDLDQVAFKVDGNKVVLRYQPSSIKTVVISSPTSGKEVQRFSLNGQRLESPIENPLPKSAVFKIEALGDKTSTILAVPGQSMEPTKAGEGTVQDLALALAGHYRVPVEVEAADVTHRVSWNFSSSDARAAANQALESEGFSVDQRQDGLIEILDR